MRKLLKTKDWRVLLLDVALVVAALILAAMLMNLADEVQYDFRLYMDEGSFISWMRYETYPHTVLYTAENRAEQKSGYDAEHLLACYAVADYYEAASLYKAYLTTGDEERAARMLERMQEAEAGMGELSFEISKIRTQLGIEADGR